MAPSDASVLSVLMAQSIWEFASAVATAGATVNAEAIEPLFLATVTCVARVTRLRAREAGVGDAAPGTGRCVISVVI